MQGMQDILGMLVVSAALVEAQRDLGDSVV